MISQVDYKCEPYWYPKQANILVSRQILINETMCLPAVKPDIEQLVSITGVPIINECKSLDNPIGRKFFIKGCLDLQLLYVADAPCQPVHAFDCSRPFETFIKSCQCQLDNIDCGLCMPQVLIEFLEANKVGCRCVSVSAILLIWLPQIHCTKTVYIDCCKPPSRFYRATYHRDC